MTETISALLADARPIGEDEWSVKDEDGSGRLRVRRVAADGARRERAAALAALDDPATTRLRRWFEAEGALYLVTEEPAGEPLAEWASRAAGDLTAASLADLGWHLAVALAVVHAAGVAHGALSATTVFRTDNGRLQIGGFTLEPSATPEGDLRDAAALLLSLAPPTAEWRSAAVAALSAVGSLTSLHDALDALGQAPPESEPEAAWDGWRRKARRQGSARYAADESEIVVTPRRTPEAEAVPELETSPVIEPVHIEVRD